MHSPSAILSLRSAHMRNVATRSKHHLRIGVHFKSYNIIVSKSIFVCCVEDLKYNMIVDKGAIALIKKVGYFGFLLGK